MGRTFIKINNGDKFNKWTVIKYQYTRNGHRYFLCECNCGIQKFVAISSLISERSKGCHKCSVIESGYKRRLPNNSGPINGIYRTYKKSAKYRIPSFI